jgi:hypothetical protein
MTETPHLFSGAAPLRPTNRARARLWVTNRRGGVHFFLSSSHPRRIFLPPPVEPPPAEQQGEEDAGPPSCRRLAPIAYVRRSLTAAP